ncbi:very short patch repair endonuclease [Veronia pacifica]|uniref:Very short patch repair endonuclease n=2 Tax=Veronia pacifica TaxID=1080227 RepID=A0A1C3EK78_9GAMM|nr:very short patch repair endonuclease [Veronia pacifica]
MRAIKPRDTKPELIVRQTLHARGFRFRLCPPNLPGKPDIWLPKYNAVIFVNGCFWHLHQCHLSHIPKTRCEFWFNKLTSNADRDKRNIRKLLASHIRVLVIWEYALKGKHSLADTSLMVLICTWLNTAASFAAIDSDGLTIKDTIV